MTVKLYVDWSDLVILSEKQAQETVTNEYCSAATSDNNFNDWLFEKYAHVDLFNMKEDEKERLRTKFLEEMKETAWQDFLDRYEVASVEI